MKLKLKDGSNQRFAIYEGETYNGKPDGKGKMIYANGDVYEGRWKDGNRHGIGTMTYADGRVEDGDWEEGKFAGEIVKPLVKKPKKYLTWDDDKEIARALWEKYPNIPPETLDREGIREKVLTLKNFKDAPHPKGDVYLTAIRRSWIMLGFGEDAEESIKRSACRSGCQ